MKATVADYNAFVEKLRAQEAKWSLSQTTPRDIAEDLMRASQINEIIESVTKIKTKTGVDGTIPDLKIPEVSPIDNNDFDLMMEVLKASAAKCRCNCDDCHCRGRHIKTANRFKRFNWKSMIKVLDWIKYGK